MGTFNDVHPQSASWEEEGNISVMKLVKVERVETLFGCDENVLITRLRMNPGSSTVDAQRTTVEDFGETGAHVHFGRRW